MTKVNVIFDNSFDDADIIAIPDEIASRIETIGQEFLDWVLTAKNSDYWVNMDGQKCLVIETDGFIKWLNSRYCSNIEEAYLVTRNTNSCPLYKSLEF